MNASKHFSTTLKLSSVQISKVYSRTEFCIFSSSRISRTSCSWSPKKTVPFNLDHNGAGFDCELPHQSKHCSSPSWLPLASDTLCSCEFIGKDSSLRLTSCSMTSSMDVWMDIPIFQYQPMVVYKCGNYGFHVLHHHHLCQSQAPRGLDNFRENPTNIANMLGS